jgi:hypothetical protein
MIFKKKGNFIGKFPNFLNLDEYSEIIDLPLKLYNDTPLEGLGKGDE